MTGTVFTACVCHVPLFSIITLNASPIAPLLASKISMHPVPRSLWQELQWVLCLHCAVAPTQPSSERDPSDHHIQVSATILASFSHAHHCADLFAVWCHSVLWSSPLIFRLGQANSFLWLSSCAHAHHELLCISLHQKRGFGLTHSESYCIHLLVLLRIAFICSLRLQASQ